MGDDKINVQGTKTRKSHLIIYSLKKNTLYDGNGLIMIYIEILIVNYHKLRQYFTLVLLH